MREDAERLHKRGSWLAAYDTRVYSAYGGLKVNRVEVEGKVFWLSWPYPLTEDDVFIALWRFRRA